MTCSKVCNLMSIVGGALILGFSSLRDWSLTGEQLGLVVVIGGELVRWCKGGA